MRKATQSQQGFTLVELMIGLTLIVVLLTGILSLLSVNLQSWRTGSSRAEVQQTARFAVDSMVRELRYARDFELANAGFEVRFWNLAKTDQYRYYLSTSDHKIYRDNITGSGSPQPVTGSTTPGAINVLINQGNEPLFEVPNKNTIMISLRATDSISKTNVSISTAVYSITEYLR